MRKPILYLIIAATPFIQDPVAAQEKTLPSLYAIANVTGPRGVVDTHQLVRLYFDEKLQLKKDIVRALNSDFFGHFGPHLLVDNRYIATHTGNVIDLEFNQIIHQENRYGLLIGVDKENVVYRVTGGFDADRLNALFAFNLKARRLDKVAKGNPWLLPGVQAPNQKMSIDQENNGGPILLHKLDGTTKELAKGFAVAYSNAPFRGGLPLLWLDDERVLTQEANGKLVTLDTNGKVEKLLEIKDAQKGVLSPPSLYRDASGRIIYRCNAMSFAIDFKEKKSSPVAAHLLGNDFAMASKLDDDGVRSIVHAGKEIGLWNAGAPRTAPGLIAFPYADPGGNLGEPRGIAIWHEGRWQTVDFWVNDLIGWRK
jgi:hypothetical protein